MATLETFEMAFDFRSRHVAERSIVGTEHLTNLKKVTVDGDEDKRALSHAILEQLKAANDDRPRSNQFQIAIKYS